MNQAIQPYGARSVSAMVSRVGAKAVQHEVEDALVAATKVEGTAYLSHLALSHVDNLSNLESQIGAAALAADPIQKEQVARRAAMLVDNFAITAASEIAKRGV